MINPERIGISGQSGEEGSSAVGITPQAKGIEPVLPGFDISRFIATLEARRDKIRTSVRDVDPTSIESRLALENNRGFAAGMHAAIMATRSAQRQESLQEQPPGSEV